MLNNKIILLTGGAEGIGWECAKAYARMGATIVIADRRSVSAGQLNQLPCEHKLFVSCDVSKEEDVRQTIDHLIQQYGRLDAIHNNAGIVHPSKPLHTTADDEWEMLMTVNVKSILFTTRYGIGHLKSSKGSILNTSSLVGEIGQDNHAAYVASKGAVNALTKAMALDYSSFGIRVNAVSPAAINTAALDAWSNQQPNKESIKKYLDHLQPLGKMPTGDVVADACAFLLSDAARFITGCILPISGGAELGYRSLIS